MNRIDEEPYLVAPGLWVPKTVNAAHRNRQVGWRLRHFQLATVLQIRRDTGRTGGMIANPRDAGG
jgi:hypothetical protein